MKVTPFEHCRFHVTSETNSNVIYLVDLSEGTGECDCADFILRKKKNSNAMCKHLVCVRNFLADEVIQALRENALGD